LHPVVDDREFSVARDLAIHLPCEPGSSDNRPSDKGPNDKGPNKFVEGEPSHAPGRIGQAYEFDARRYVDCGNVADFGYFDKFTISAWIKRDGESDGVLWSRMIDEPDGKLNVSWAAIAGQLCSVG
jgi:hypothetical protein